MTEQYFLQEAFNMSGEFEILIVGGDKRMQMLGKILTERGYYCIRENRDFSTALSLLDKARVVVLPIPVSKDGINIFSDNTEFRLSLTDVFNTLKSGQIVVSGGISGKYCENLEGNGVHCFNLNNCEEFTVYNAYLTAQGALKLLLDNTQSYVNGKYVLVTGFGRVAKALCAALKGLNMHIIVAARNRVQLCEAECMGYKTIYKDNISNDVFMFDYIFNTIPYPVFSKDDIRMFKKGCIYFELASHPYGASAEDFISENKKYVPAPALPGKYTAYSAAEKIADYFEFVYKRGETHG